MQFPRVTEFKVFLTLVRIFEGSRSKTELATRLATGFKARMIQTQFSDAPATTADLTRRNRGDAAGLTMAVATPPSATWPALDKNPFLCSLAPIFRRMAPLSIVWRTGGSARSLRLRPTGPRQSWWRIIVDVDGVIRLRDSVGEISLQRTGR
jgi:hypothetical protein